MPRASSLVFNTIGWRPSNLLFNAVDAILGDPLISTAFDGQAPFSATASIRGTHVAATGDVTVTATQASRSTPWPATRRSPTPADGVLTKGSATKGLAGGGLLASNKVNTKATASDRVHQWRRADLPPTAT